MAFWHLDRLSRQKKKIKDSHSAISFNFLYIVCDISVSMHHTPDWNCCKKPQNLFSQLPKVGLMYFSKQTVQIYPHLFRRKFRWDHWDTSPFKYLEDCSFNSTPSLFAVSLSTAVSLPIFLPGLNICSPLPTLWPAALCALHSSPLHKGPL